MRRPNSICIALVALCGLASPAKADQQTFVASSGNDASPSCNRAAPCRTFARALARTDSNGDIVALDSAEYGPLTIDRSVSIIAAEGVYASISVNNYQTAIDIPTGGLTVVLQGLVLRGEYDTTGINLAARSADPARTFLTVKGCTVSGFYGHGLLATGLVHLQITDSAFRENLIGVSVVDGVQATISKSTFFHNGLYSVEAVSPSDAQHSSFTSALISDSVLEGSVDDFGSAAMRVASPNGYPVYIRFAGSVVTGNNHVMTSQGGNVDSFGTNLIFANGDETLTSVVPLK